MLKFHLSNYITSNNNNKKITIYLTFKIKVKKHNDIHFKYFNTEIYVLKSLKSLYDYIIKLLDNFTNWLDELYNVDFLGVIKIDIKTIKQSNIYGGEFVDLPYFIKCKKACINIKNVELTKNSVIKYDNKCFISRVLLVWKH